MSRESEVDRAQLLRELMEAHGNDVVRTVYLYVRDRHAAEDIAQDVFVKVYDHLDTFRRDSSYRTWILRIAANAAKDYLRAAA
ncbi:MAG: sigma-70 family RNA polymerase sigma factor, partial [Firmicutes bacterium]|nr:sigma-70 family RNA polymerase sigma factor [Bacillota bacterium]